MEASPFAEVGRTGAEVNGDVPNVAGEDPDELSLRLAELVMESSQYAFGGERLVVLDKFGGQIMVGKGFMVINFCEPTATISKALGL